LSDLVADTLGPLTTARGGAQRLLDYMLQTAVIGARLLDWPAKDL
jgi:hypothetical protein